MATRATPTTPRTTSPGTSPSRTPGAPARALTPEIVVATALEIADREGLGAVTLARVARELGCHVTSLYTTHIDSIDDLHARMGLAAQSALAQRLWEAALGRSGADALRALADVYRDFGSAHPEQIRLLFAGAATTDPRVLEGARYLAEPIRATLRGFGLDDEQVRHAHRAFSAAVRGFSMAEAQGAYPTDADITFDQIVDLFVQALERGSWPRLPRVIPPNVEPDDEYFWSGVQRHQLLLQRCASCHTLRHPPVPMCGACHSLDWDTQEATGRGTVYSWVLSHHPSEPDAEARVVVLVELEEGVRFVANLVDADPDGVRNEMAVEVCFVELDGVLLPQFRAAAGNA